MLATVYLMKMRVHRTRKRAAYVCAAIWILSLITISPIFMYATVHKTNNGHARCHVKFPGLTKDEKWTGSAEMLTGAVLNPPLLELTTVADGVAVGSGDDFVFSDDATSGGGANAETSDTEVTSLVTTLATTTTESFEDWMIRMRPKPKERNNGSYLWQFVLSNSFGRARCQEIRSVIFQGCVVVSDFVRNFF